MTHAPELWHYDEELPTDWMGDVTLYDESGLTVCRCLGLASAKAMVEEQARYRALWQILDDTVGRFITLTINGDDEEAVDGK